MLLIQAFSLHAQDIHFSQFYFAPQVINPANTGNFDGNWRVINNTRRQWGAISPYTTFSLGFDKQFSIKTERLGWGVLVMSDLSNSSNLVVNKIYLSGSYKKLFSGHNIALGLQAGIVNKYFDMNNLTFGDQFDETSGTYSSNIGTQETNFRESFTYPDINIGLKWDTEIGIAKPYAGASFFHINSPKESFFEEDNKLPMLMLAHLGSNIDVTEKIYVTPNYMYMSMNGTQNMLFGSNVTYKLSDDMLENSVFMGLYARNVRDFSSMIILVGMNYQHWRVGLSYDLNTSELKTSNANPGGFEISILYREISTFIQKFFIPCERF